MNVKAFTIGAALLLSVGYANAQSSSYLTRIHLINEGVDKKLRDTKNGLYYESTDSAKNENPHSWLWPLTAMLQAANEMETLEPAKHYMQPVDEAIQQYYSDAPPVPAYQDYVMKEKKSSRFYDDNEWIAITYLDAYNRTHKPMYLDRAKMIERFIQSGIDTVTGGGVYWKEGDFQTKNTCSNGPAILVALQLYKITKQTSYLNEALNLYAWTNRNLQTPEGIYWDNINTKTHHIAKALFTYNTGTMLQSNVLLYEITHDKKYLLEAKRVAQAGRAYFFKNGRLPNHEYWFNAVMLRGYQALYAIDPNKAWVDFYIEDGNQIWNTERGPNNLVSATPNKRLIDQGAMMEIYARLQEIANSKH